jgi:hypothetical protein
MRKETLQQQLAKQVGFIDRSKQPVTADAPIQGAVHLLPEIEQIPTDSRDKSHEGNNTTHQPKLEDIHMTTHSTETATSKRINDERIAQLDTERAELRNLTGFTPEQIVFIKDAVGSTADSMHKLTAALTAKKSYTDHAVEVGKVAGGVALGLGLAFGVKAGVDYLFFKPVG